MTRLGFGKSICEIRDLHHEAHRISANRAFSVQLGAADGVCAGLFIWP
jgi:hypothetical protein